MSILVIGSGSKTIGEHLANHVLCSFKKILVTRDVIRKGLSESEDAADGSWLKKLRHLRSCVLGPPLPVLSTRLSFSGVPLQE